MLGCRRWLVSPHQRWWPRRPLSGAFVSTSKWRGSLSFYTRISGGIFYGEYLSYLRLGLYFVCNRLCRGALRANLRQHSSTTCVVRSCHRAFVGVVRGFS